VIASMPPNNHTGHGPPKRARGNDLFIAANPPTPHSIMGNKNKKKTKSNGKNVHNKEKKKAIAIQTRHDNFYHEAGPGCHIARPPSSRLGAAVDGGDGKTNNTKKKPNQHHRQAESGDSSWVLGWEAMDDGDDDPESEYGKEEDIPDIGIDTDERTISICNASSTDTKVAYLTVYDVVLHGRHGRSLRQGWTTETTTTTKEDDKGDASSPHAQQEEDHHEALVQAVEATRNNAAAVGDAVPKVVPCTTLIVLCPPRTFCHLCHIPKSSSWSSYDDDDLRNLRIDSDVQVWQPHPDPADTYDRLLGFPLGDGTAITGDDDATTTGGSTTTTATRPHDSNHNVGSSNDHNEIPQEQQQSAPLQRGHHHRDYLCTQGVGGTLTHFFRGNYHAVDFRCDIGTPVLAVGNGKVKQVRDQHGHVSGIGTSNLYEWNAILIKLDQTDLKSVLSPAAVQDDDHDGDAHADVDDDDGDNDSSNDLIIRSSPELFVEYVHIQSSLVQVGDRVRKGDIIGTSGSAVRISCALQL
jgi:murein DD-endopeptidase MepM/ murein hydrolase activator NlpD